MPFLDTNSNPWYRRLTYIQQENRRNQCNRSS
jgi:hypothetical protein